MIDFPDGTLRREQDLCREKLDAASRRCTDERSPENRAEYLRALRAFTELVMNEDVRQQYRPFRTLQAAFGASPALGNPDGPGNPTLRSPTRPGEL